MNKILTTAIGLFMATCSLQAQTPQSVCYQGVATDASGIELQARTINIRTTILSDAPNGTAEWTEIHQVQTDDFGLFNLNIGQGAPAGGTAPTFSAIEWGEHAFFLRVEMDENGGTDYQLMGINQMLSVPYALYSKGSDRANIAQIAVVADSASVAQFAYSALNDEDISPTNEIQTLTYNEGTGELTLSGSNAVILSGLVDTDDQNAAQVDVTNGTYSGQTVEEALENINANLSADADTDATNELQNAEGVNVTTGTFNGQTVTEALEEIQSGLGGVDGDGDATNEIQAAAEVDIAGGTFNGQNVQQALENINFALEADEDGDSTNELQAANEVNVTGGIYTGQTVEEALGNVNSAVTTINTQITQVINEVEADGDGDSTNELQNAESVNVTTGAFSGQTVTEALEAIQSGLGGADGDSDATNEIQDATEVEIASGTFNGQNVQQALENINFALDADNDGDSTNELQNAGQVNVTAGTYNGQSVEEALENVSSDVSTINTQITQVINDAAADGDGDATNELQEANEVNVTGGVYNGQTVEEALGNVNSQVTTFSTQITQVINDVAADGDGDSTNELQNAGQVNVTAGTYNGQSVEEALENVSSDVSTINTQITQVINDAAADGDGDATNELQEANEVNVTGGVYTGQTVEEALGNVNSQVTTFSTQITQVINDVAADGDGDSTNELQNAGQVNVTAGTYNGQSVEEALENVSSDVSTINTQITQVINDAAADGDGDATNELQEANEVNVTGGVYTGQTVEEALGNVNSQVTTFSTQITQVINDVAADGDGDSTNELQNAGQVNVTAGTYNGQSVEEALENVSSDVSTINTQITQVINDAAADGDGDATNELQEANEVNVTGGVYTGQTVEEALGNVNSQVTTFSTQITQVINDVAADGDGDSTNELQEADEVNISSGTYNGQTVQQVLENINTTVGADGDGDATNELQTANQVNITGGTYSGQDIQQALQIIAAALAADNDTNPTNEIQTAGQVQVDNGSFDGATVEQALEVLNSAIMAGDGDGDATNELQNASQVNVTNGSYSGMSVEAALELLTTALTADNDGDATNEIQAAAGVEVEGGLFVGENVEAALDSLQTRINADNDGDSTNEIQELIYDGETIGITGGNSISLSDVAFGAPGASIRYPQGIFGDYIVVTSASYQVPTGKNFYLTGGPPTINLAINGISYAHPTAPSMPIFEAGQIIQNCNCLGLLIDANEVIETEMVNFQSSLIYTVPVGKVFIVKSGMVNDDVSYLVVNGVQIEFFRPNFLRASNLLSFPAGTTLQMPNNVSTMVLTGYLIEIE